MRLDGNRESSNVEDRGPGGGGVLVGGGLGTIVLALLAVYMGVDPRVVLHNTPRSPQVQQTSSPEREQEKKFVSKVLADTEDTWHKLLPGYREPKLVLFGGRVETACGRAGSAVGPFYCGEDEKLYVDLDFYKELSSRLGAPGDFAEAYVIAHEVGHHVQKLKGTLEKVHAAEERMSKSDRNRISVRLELQADYYAGVWAHYARQEGILEVGDIEEGLQAASAVGDDRLQQQANGTVVPDSFTHGTSEQRVRWFKKGLDSGDPNGGNTFQTADL